jgi:SAM-dependent methyltransferase
MIEARNDLAASFGNFDGYACPTCKVPLQELSCRACGVRFKSRLGIPDFLPRDQGPDEAERICDTYDAIYAKHSDVWVDQGRGKEFRHYVARLVAGLHPVRVLEIGCGEGLMLAALPGIEKLGMDISHVALQRARALTDARCAIGIAEMLPYPSASVDAVVSIGVMEHLMDVTKANVEVHRVLKDGGYFVAVIHTRMGYGQRLIQKCREFLLPPQPKALYRWLTKKMSTPIRQPAKNRYSIESATKALGSCGLEVVRVISRITDKDAPFAGSHVVLYLCRKG